jgi:hypothetical protein
MSWNSLGAVIVSTDWQVIDQATSASTFRISFLGDLDRTWYFARIRQYYSAEEVSLSTRIYPKQESIILELPIPQELQSQGVTARYLGVCKFPFRRYTVVDSDWQIMIEELV